MLRPRVVRARRELGEGAVRRDSEREVIVDGGMRVLSVVPNEWQVSW